MDSPTDGRSRRLRLTFAFGLAVLVAAPVVLATQEDDHDHAPSALAPTRFSQLSGEQRVRARRLFNEIMCDCPKENFSRTLYNCPDACADPQKDVVIGMVGSGNADEEILRAMLRRVDGDRRVLAAPDSGLGRVAYVLPFIALGIGAVAAFLVLKRWKARGEVARDDRADERTGLDADEIARVERELAQLD